MNGLDQAFIDAYRTPADGGDIPPAAAVVPPRAGRSSGNRAWRRMDAGAATGGVPRPHAPAKPRVEPLAYPVEVSIWDTSLVSTLNTTFVAANVVTCLPEQAAREEQHGNVPAEPQPPAAKVATPASPAVPVPLREPVSHTPAPEEMELTDRDPAPAARAEETPAPFKPVWEVDRFAWPADVERVYSAETAYFAHAGQKLREAAREGLRVLVVTSARAAEGCTTLAICLARAAAEAGVRVALLDANVRAPNLGQRMGVKFAHGWTEAVRGDVPLGETAISSVERPVTLLPLASPAADDAPLADARVGQTIRCIAAGVELLIIDLGSALDESGVWLTRSGRCPVDAAIVVRDVRTTAESETLAVAARLQELGVTAVGVAENYTARQPSTEQAAA